MKGAAAVLKRFSFHSISWVIMLSCVLVGEARPGFADAGQAVYVPGQGYFAITGGSYCSFPSQSYYFSVGSQYGGYNIQMMSALPAGLSNAGTCQPVNQLFIVNNAIYYENASGHYCGFADWSYYTGIMGRTDVANIPTLSQIPAGAVSDGACNPTGLFIAQGGIYYANSSGHYCQFQDPSYFFGLTGRTSAAGLIQFDELPPSGISDGACAPQNAPFIYGSAIYYSNGNGDYCWIPNMSVFTSLTGQSGIQGVPTFDALPFNKTNLGTCGG